MIKNGRIQKSVLQKFPKKKQLRKILIQTLFKRI